jgi:hypothetical protein
MNEWDYKFLSEVAEYMATGRLDAAHLRNLTQLAKTLKENGAVKPNPERPQIERSGPGADAVAASVRA